MYWFYSDFLFSSVIDFPGRRSFPVLTNDLSKDNRIIGPIQTVLCFKPFYDILIIFWVMIQKRKKSKFLKFLWITWYCSRIIKKGQIYSFLKFWSILTIFEWVARLWKAWIRQFLPVLLHKTFSFQVRVLKF